MLKMLKLNQNSEKGLACIKQQNNSVMECVEVFVPIPASDLLTKMDEFSVHICLWMMRRQQIWVFFFSEYV